MRTQFIEVHCSPVRNVTFPVVLESYTLIGFVKQPQQHREGSLQEFVFPHIGERWELGLAFPSLFFYSANEALEYLYSPLSLQLANTPKDEKLGMLNPLVTALWSIGRGDTILAYQLTAIDDTSQ